CTLFVIPMGGSLDVW
nr:immunoglobulin heavy chain junction region [Macaca mulatta]MOW19147.1 immunoglobulin heavy chain junction region [Macaca mulatta]MOW19224.1 immunoglobulin heavy chain junction region [Macaca mulatta]MOW19317.1 immunoglobulin heavy chain junction region [Macaca mulatta]MOW19431.1 immunoglobulin heavy chain junction region [Macaca mulatta]